MKYNKKAIELSLEIIVIFIILVITLIVVLFFFTSNYSNGQNSLIGIGKDIINYSK